MDKTFENEGEDSSLKLLECRSLCSALEQTGSDPCPCPETPETETAEYEDEEEGEDAEETCGCPCQENRFFLSFQDTTHLGDICLDESRLKCKAFWDFVDSNERFKKLIKQGHYPKPPPQPACYAACGDVCPSTGKFKARASKSEEVRASVALPVEIKYRSKAQRVRFQNRRNAVADLQLRSGQPIIHAKPQVLPSHFRNVYADEVNEISPLDCLQ